MPNWCNNKLILSGSKPVITTLFEKIKKDGLLQTLQPMPDDEAVKKWHAERPFTEFELQSAAAKNREPQKGFGIPGEDVNEWCLKHWGTKWEVNDPDFHLEDDGTCIEGYFATAWTPPIEAYEHFLAQNGGCEIEAYYCEPDCQFAGVFVNGCDEEICDEEFDAPPEKRGYLWQAIDDHMGLAGIYDMIHEDDDEDEDDDE